MMRAAPLLAAPLAVCVGCTPYTPDQSGLTGAVELALVAAPPAAELARFTQLDLVLDEIVVDGQAPSGHESVAVIVDAAFAPLAAEDAVGFRLERGTHTDVTLGLVFAGVDALGVLAAGALDDDDGFRFEVERLALSFDLPRVVVGATPVPGRVVFRPGAWVEALGLDDDGDDTDDTDETDDTTDPTTPTDTGDDDDDTSTDDTGDTGDDGTGDDAGSRSSNKSGDDEDDVVVIGPGSGAVYDQLLRAIVDSTTLEIDGVAAAR